MAAVDDGAADDEAVPADPFGQRMHDEVGAEFYRPAQVGCGEGVVDQEREARPMGKRSDGGNIKNFEAGIADCLADYELGVFPDRGGEVLVIARFDEGRRDPEARQRLGEQVDGSAVERRRSDDVVAGAGKGRDGEVQRRHAAGGGDGADAVFQRRNALFEHRRGRIRDAAIDVPGAFEVEQLRRVIAIGKDVRGGLVDRHGARAGGGIGTLTGVQGERIEFGRARRHGEPLGA